MRLTQVFTRARVVGAKGLAMFVDKRPKTEMAIGKDGGFNLWLGGDLAANRGWIDL